MILGCMLNDSWLMLGRYSFSLLIFVHFQQRILFEKTAFSWGFSGSLQKWTPSLNREHATLVGKRLPPLLKSSMLLKFNFLGNNPKKWSHHPQTIVFPLCGLAWKKGHHCKNIPKSSRVLLDFSIRCAWKSLQLIDPHEGSIARSLLSRHQLAIDHHRKLSGCSPPGCQQGPM